MLLFDCYGQVNVNKLRVLFPVCFKGGMEFIFIRSLRRAFRTTHDDEGGVDGSEKAREFT